MFRPVARSGPRRQSLLCGFHAQPPTAPPRLASHQRGCRSDPLRSPLTRWAMQMFGGMDKFKIVVLSGGVRVSNGSILQSSDWDEYKSLEN